MKFFLWKRRTIEISYLPYIITEAFCILFSLILLFRLRKGYGLNKEIQTLQILFLINIILLSTDIFWALIEENLLHPPVLINAAINASADMSVACGCYFWYCFTGERLHYPFYESKTAADLSGFLFLFSVFWISLPFLQARFFILTRVIITT